MKFLAKLLVNAFGVIVVAYILPGVVVNSFWTALMVAVVLGILNTFFRPIIIFFTLPLTIMTLGLFTFVINAFLILLVSNFVSGFQVANFITALLFSIILTIVNSLLNFLTRE